MTDDAAGPPIHVYVDADGCPVKDEIYRVARRCGLRVTLVANRWMRTPHEEWLHLEVVEEQFDAADDWIADQASADDIVITEDIPLASRCLEKGAQVLAPRGRVFTEDDIGEAMAVRELMSHLRDVGTVGGGPPPFQQWDRSYFLQRLDEIVQRILRTRARRKRD